MQRADPSLTLRDFTFLYGMSKQVVFKENEGALNYLRVKQIELIELIGRYSDFKFLSTSQEGDKLLTKVTVCIDSILGAVGLE